LAEELVDQVLLPAAAEGGDERRRLVKIFGDPTREGAQGFNAFLEDEKRFVGFKSSAVFAAKEIVFVDDGSN
jgi:hypothetical protein